VAKAINCSAFQNDTVMLQYWPAYPTYALDAPNWIQCARMIAEPALPTLSALLDTSHGG